MCAGLPKGGREQLNSEGLLNHAMQTEYKLQRLFLVD
jgi:hypothetical protein